MEKEKKSVRYNKSMSMQLRKNPTFDKYVELGRRSFVMETKLLLSLTTVDIVLVERRLTRKVELCNRDKADIVFIELRLTQKAEFLESIAELAIKRLRLYVLRHH